MKISMLMAGIAIAITSSPAMSQDYDMDCKLILCLAGGFPAGCADAKSYMLTRIRKLKPPIGVCSMVNADGSSGGDYEAINTEYSFLTPAADERGWACADSAKKLGYSREELEYTSKLKGFCYDRVTYIQHSGGHDGNPWEEPVYHGVVSAREVDFQVRVTVEPGKPNQYRSNLFKVNTHTGFTAELP